MVMSFGSDVVEGDDDDGFGGWVEAFGDGSSLGPIGFKKSVRQNVFCEYIRVFIFQETLHSGTNGDRCSMHFILRCLSYCQYCLYPLVRPANSHHPIHCIRSTRYGSPRCRRSWRVMWNPCSCRLCLWWFWRPMQLPCTLRRAGVVSGVQDAIRHPDEVAQRHTPTADGSLS